MRVLSRARVGNSPRPTDKPCATSALHALLQAPGPNRSNPMHRAHRAKRSALSNAASPQVTFICLAPFLAAGPGAALGADFPLPLVFATALRFGATPSAVSSLSATSVEGCSSAVCKVDAMFSSSCSSFA